jgi:CRISPR-associated protein Cas2
MAPTHPLFVFAYDISRDRARARVAALLEDHAVRVQKSVFEGRMTERRAKGLATRIERHLAPGDSLRVYILHGAAAGQTMVFGATPPVETHEFYLL